MRIKMKPELAKAFDWLIANTTDERWAAISRTMEILSSPPEPSPYTKKLMDMMFKYLETEEGKKVFVEEMSRLGFEVED